MKNNGMILFPNRIVNGSIVYNFTDLDNLIDLLYQNGLKPGFELMGNPGGLFKDFDTRTDVFMWKDLVTQVTQRYVGREMFSVLQIS